jgi:predicted ATPase/predicted N-acetyltransferase YhbS
MPEDDDRAGNPPHDGTAHLVVVSGCSGGGKSSLLSEMAHRGYSIRPEPGRQIVKEQSHIEGDAVPWGNIPKFVELCVSRGMYFYNMAKPTNQCVLFDRSIVDAVSSLARLGLPTPAHLRNALQRYRYARVVFMTPPWEELFATDRERRHSFSDAVAEYEGLLTDYPANGYEVELIPPATVHERADFLEQQLGRRYDRPRVLAPKRDGDAGGGGIRLAEARDRAAVAACIKAAFEGFTARIGKPPAPMLADYRGLIEAGRVHLLEAEEAVVGVLVTELRPDHLFVDTVAVHPAAQRRGSGRRLMALAEQEARRRGLAEVRLYTHEVMDGALALYRGLGYEETERRLEDGYARVYLRIILAGQR